MAPADTNPATPTTTTTQNSRKVTPGDVVLVKNDNGKALPLMVTDIHGEGPNQSISGVALDAFGGDQRAQAYTSVTFGKSNRQWQWRPAVT